MLKLLSIGDNLISVYSSIRICCDVANNFYLLRERRSIKLIFIFLVFAIILLLEQGVLQQYNLCNEVIF